MTKPLVVLPQAESDLRAAATDYELQAPGLARAFIGAVREAFNHIEQTPGLYRESTTKGRGPRKGSLLTRPT